MNATKFQWNELARSEKRISRSNISKRYACPGRSRAAPGGARRRSPPSPTSNVNQRRYPRFYR